MAFLHDALWVPLALLLAFWVRFNLGEIPPNYLSAMTSMFVVCLLVQAASFWFFDLYRGIWRFASMPDLLRIARAIGVGVLLSFALLFVWLRLEGVPRSVLFLYPMFLLAGLTLPRLLYRWFKDRRVGFSEEQGKRTLIVGAGQAGELLLRDMLKTSSYEPVALLDDDLRKQGMELHGVRVLGAVNQLSKFTAELNIEVVLLAMPSMSHATLQKMVDTCASQGIPCRVLPSLSELTAGKISVGQLRDVRIEDLLGREEVILDETPVRALLKNRCVLVTGAGGSIGSELCRQILAYAPSHLLLLDHGEFNLYQIDQELGEGEDVTPILGDIRDESRMRWVFERYQPQVVFNAAAYKHVPLVEANPAEGVKTNVLGTCRLADLVVEYGCHTFVQVSTDKAVNPTNVMGASKRAAEIYCQNLNARQATTAFITTRFGNVLGSAGSVVPLFKKQIAKGGPVTVTHPDMTRYFMTIPEAVRLILQAGSMGKGGEIFVLDMGEPVKIVSLAEQLIRLSGLEPYKDISITFTGLRPGEKMYEELFHQQEALSATHHPKIMLSGSRSVDWDELQGRMRQLQEVCAQRDVEQVKVLLKELVPEFVSSTTH